MEGKIIVKQNILGGILYALGSLIFTILGFLFLNVSPLGIFPCLFFVLGFVYFTLRLIKRKPILIVDDKGITDNSSAISVGFIPWEDVEDIVMDECLGNEFIEIKLVDEEKYIKRLSDLSKKAVIANKKMGHEAVCITLNSTGKNPNLIYSEMLVIFDKVKNKDK